MDLFLVVLPTPRSAQPILTKLRDRARAAAAIASADNLVRRTSDDISSTIDAKYVKDEDALSVLGGGTRLVSKRTSSRSASAMPLGDYTRSASSSNGSLSPQSLHASTPPSIPLPPEPHSPIAMPYHPWDDAQAVNDFPPYNLGQETGYPAQYLAQYPSGPSNTFASEYLSVFQGPQYSGIPSMPVTQPLTVDSLLFATDPTVAWNNFIAQFKSGQ